MSDETIGELHDCLPEGQWVDLLGTGLRVKRIAVPPVTETEHAQQAQLNPNPEPEEIPHA